jgi:hypothetical protein
MFTVRLRQVYTLWQELTSVSFPNRMVDFDIAFIWSYTIHHQGGKSPWYQSEGLC